MRLRRHSSARVVAALLLAVTVCAAGSSAVAATSTRRPDLVVSAVSGTPAKVQRGAPLSLSAEVTNQGNAGAGSSTVRWYLKAADGTRRALTSAGVPSLVKGASVVREKSWTVASKVTAGSYQLQACADTARAVVESREGNNCTQTPVTVVARPDLVVSAVSGSPATVERGALLSLSAEVTNQGNAGARSSTVGWYLKAADGTRRFLVSAGVPSLARGASVVRATSWTVASDVAAGSHQLQACADTAGVVVEGREGNNCTQTPVTVEEPVPACTIIGTEGPDVLEGTEAADVICGLGDDDTIEGLEGNDEIDGGNGSDTILYAAAGSAVTVNLADGVASGGAGDDVLANVENVTGSGFDDTISGDDGANSLAGGRGADTINGLAGQDVIREDVTEGATGDHGDVFAGGEGTDKLDYCSHSDDDCSLLGGVVVDIDAETSTGGSGNDMFSGIEDVAGSDHDDTIFGDENANVLDGGGGIDTITGRAGADTIFGGSGDDFLRGGAGDVDTIDAQDGTDTCGEPVDTRISCELAFNVPATLTINDATNTYTQGDPPKTVDSTLTLTDDEANTESATITIGSGYESGKDFLSISGVFPSGVTVNYVAPTLTISGPATVAQYETMLRNVKFENRALDPSTADRIITFTVFDGEFSDSDDVTMSVVASP